MDQGVIDYIANVFDIPKLAQPVMCGPNAFAVNTIGGDIIR